MMMNEIEVVLWSIYLDRFVWKELGTHLKLMIYMTAFAVKSYMGCQVEPFLAYLTFKFNHFSAYFNKWLVNAKSRLTTSPSEINKKFSFLSGRMKIDEVKLVNLNFVVDYILDMAPPYSQDKQPKIDSQSSSLQSSYFDQTLPCPNINVEDIEGKEVQSEDEVQPQGLMVRMDSVFAYPCKVSEIHETNEQLKMSFDISNSWMLDNLDTGKEVIEDEPLPHLVGETSYFTYYMSQSNS
jgi:hypothetical protein